MRGGWRRTSDFVFEASDHGDGLLQDHELGERLGVASVEVDHLAEFFESVVDLADAQSAMPGGALTREKGSSFCGKIEAY